MARRTAGACAATPVWPSCPAFQRRTWQRSGQCADRGVVRWSAVPGASAWARPSAASRRSAPAPGQGRCLGAAKQDRQQPLLRAPAKHPLRNPPWPLIQCTTAPGAAPLCSRTCGEAFQRGGHAGGVGGRPVCLCLVHNQGQLGVQRLRREGKGRAGSGVRDGKPR